MSSAKCSRKLESFNVPECRHKLISALIFVIITVGFFVLAKNIGGCVDTIEKIKQQIADNTILLYMKGTPKMPQCGFSARAVQCIDACGVDFAYVDVLANPDIRQTLPQVADWPTFPQLYVKGELIGGSDIIAELYQQGELEPLLKEAIKVC